MRHISVLFAAAAVAISAPVAQAQMSDDLEQLSKRARAKHAALLEAARSGDLGALDAIAAAQDRGMDLGFGGAQTVTEFATGSSQTGDGLDALAELANLLELPYQRVQTDNLTYYVWPYLDRLDLSTMTDADKVAAYQLVPPDQVTSFVEYGGWLSYRIIIDADGTWVSWVAGD